MVSAEAGRPRVGTEVAELVAGLVSPAAAELLGRLSREEIPIGHEAGQMDVTSGPGGELFDIGVLCFRGDNKNRSAVAQPSATVMRRLLDRQHRRAAELQSQLQTAWLRYTEIDPIDVSRADSAVDGVRLIGDYEELAKIASGLYRSPRRILRATLNGTFAAGSAPQGVLLPPVDAIAAGAEFRMIYDVAHVDDVWGTRSVEMSVASGEQAKVRTHVPIKMMHVDDSVALVTVDATGAAGGLYIESPPLLHVLAEWFDLLWADPGSAAVYAEGDEGGLTDTQRHLIRLMAAGLTDESIASRTGKSVRTVRRHIGSILTILQVESRFAAGVAAAKRGWV